MNDYKFKHWELAQKQTLPLEQKVNYSITRIRDWYEYWNGDVFVAFSGGKDSLVLLHIVRSLYPDIPAVFVDTGVEWPEVREFVKTFPNVVWLKPLMSYPTVLKTHGYPVISKQIAKRLRYVRHPTADNAATMKLYLEGIKSDGTTGSRFKIPTKWQFLRYAPFEISEKCCDELKKKPIQKYIKETGRRPMVGNIAEESIQRKLIYYKEGCNRFTGRDPISRPLSIWTEKDIWDYIKLNELKYCPIYDMGLDRTGCMYCLFGIHLEEDDRFEFMKKWYPTRYTFCMDYLGYREVLDYIWSKGLSTPKDITTSNETQG